MIGFLLILHPQKYFSQKISTTPKNSPNFPLNFTPCEDTLNYSPKFFTVQSISMLYYENKSFSVAPLPCRVVGGFLFGV